MAVIDNPPGMPDCNACEELKNLLLEGYPRAYIYKDTELTGNGNTLKLKKGDCLGLVYARGDGKWTGSTKCLKKNKEKKDGLEKH